MVKYTCNDILTTGIVPSPTDGTDDFLVSALPDVNVHRVTSAFTSVVAFAGAIIPLARVLQKGQVHDTGAATKSRVREQCRTETLRLCSELIVGRARVLYVWTFITRFCKIEISILRHFSLE